MELENIILSEVTQTDPERHVLTHALTHRWFLNNKAKKTSLQITIPENLDNDEDPKRDIHGSNLHGK